MYLSKEERDELSDLSKEVFGTRSRWQKMITQGYMDVVMRKVQEIVPGVDGADPTIKTTEVPALTEFGAKQIVTKFHTVDSIREHMLTLKRQREEIVAAIKSSNEEIKAKQDQEQLMKNIQDQATGSAL
jgi:hypothetical protein